MNQRHRSLIRYRAHHSTADTAWRFRLSERQVRRIVRDEMDRFGCATEYELFVLAERRERRHGALPEPLWA